MAPSSFTSQSAADDTYSLVFQTELKGIKGLRLEALADSRLPRGGPGWGGIFRAQRTDAAGCFRRRAPKRRDDRATKRVGGFQPDGLELGRPKSG